MFQGYVGNFFEIYFDHVWEPQNGRVLFQWLMATTVVRKLKFYPALKDSFLYRFNLLRNRNQAIYCKIKFKVISSSHFFDFF